MPCTIPGKENTLADAISRLAYPAFEELEDLIKHGSINDETEMEAFIQEEVEEECLCMAVQAHFNWR